MAARPENGVLLLALAAGHVLVMGLSGWLAPQGWPGFLPPISLVAFIAAVIPLLVKLFLLTKPTPTRDRTQDSGAGS